jgi:hypothetical protein
LESKLSRFQKSILKNAEIVKTQAFVVKYYSNCTRLKLYRRWFKIGYPCNFQTFKKIHTYSLTFKDFKDVSDSEQRNAILVVNKILPTKFLLILKVPKHEDFSLAFLH